MFLKGHPMYNKELLIEPKVHDIPLRIRRIEGRGRALVVKEPIAAGDVFLREPPLWSFSVSRSSTIRDRVDDADCGRPVVEGLGCERPALGAPTRGPRGARIGLLFDSIAGSRAAGRRTLTRSSSLPAGRVRGWRSPLS